MCSKTNIAIWAPRAMDVATLAATPSDARTRGASAIAIDGDDIRGVKFGAEHSLSQLESSMSKVEVEQKTYEMPPREGFTVAHFLTVADVERSLRFYETVFDGRVLSRGDSSGAPGYIQIANTWLLVNPGGGPTPDKPTVTLSVPPDPDRISSFMNIRVADIQACYELWRSRGAEFITEPKPKYGETRCYIRDPDGYIIEVGQSNPGVAYG
jgi:predicted enzyme related to lactoylglutathione lyase